MTEITRKLERLTEAERLLKEELRFLRRLRGGDRPSPIEVTTHYQQIDTFLGGGGEESTGSAEVEQVGTPNAASPPPPRPPEETITVFFHSHADTGEHLGCNWADPPAQCLDIVGMHTDYAVDLLLTEIENQQSPLNDDIEERRRANWPEWAEKAVRFVIGWDDGYSVERYEVIGTPPAPAEGQGEVGNRNRRESVIGQKPADPAVASGDARPFDAAVSSAGDDFDAEALRSKAEHYNNTSKQPADFNVRDVLGACDAIDSLREKNKKLHAQVLDYENREAGCCPEDTPFEAVIEKLRVKVEQLQKRAGEWEQKDVASFEKTIADLREKLTAAEREAAEWAARYGTAEKAERELESYAATDRTASLALIDVTRERDDAVLSMRQISDARDQILLEIDAANAKVERLREAGDAVAKALNERCNAAEGPWSGSEFAAWEDWDRARAALTETGGDDDE